MARFLILETEHWASANFEVVASTIVEVNLVAHFHSHANRSPEAFYSSTWIQSELRGAVINCAQRSHETR